MTKFSAAQQSQLAQIGAFLRENREVQGKSLEDIAIHTYIRPQLLNGIETGDPDLLPEPIFVQGFIRRYADNLGLKGIELSQQFTVNSIPSTPRPVRPLEMPESSSTRRIPRKVTESNGSAMTGARSSGLGSAGLGTSGLGAPGLGASGLGANGSSAPAADSTSPLTVDNSPPIKADFLDESHSSPQLESKELSNDLSTDSPLVTDDTEIETASLEPLFEPTTDDTPIVSGEFEPIPEKPALEAIPSEAIAIEDNSSLEIAEFDQLNLEPQTIESETEDKTASSETYRLENTSLEGTDSEDKDSEDKDSEDKDSEDFGIEGFGTEGSTTKPLQFDDELPAPSTAEIDAAETLRTSPATTSKASPSAVPDISDTASKTIPDIAPVAPAVEQPVEPEATTPRAAYSPEPVGAEPVGTEIRRADKPNLKLFAVGAVVIAAVAAGIVLFANLLGGEQQPSVTEVPEATTEQTIETPPVEEAPAPAPPPVSTAPIYVEATATGEAWVSIIADGNSLLFEGTLNLGDTKLWEAQETLSIYSGNAGALQLAQNGNAAEVMGASGQPQEKIFNLE